MGHMQEEGFISSLKNTVFINSIKKDLHFYLIILVLGLYSLYLGKENALLRFRLLIHHESSLKGLVQKLNSLLGEVRSLKGDNMLLKEQLISAAPNKSALTPVSPSSGELVSVVPEKDVLIAASDSFFIPSSFPVDAILFKKLRIPAAFNKTALTPVSPSSGELVSVVPEKDVLIAASDSSFIPSFFSELGISLPELLFFFSIFFALSLMGLKFPSWDAWVSFFSTNPISGPASGPVSNYVESLDTLTFFRDGSMELVRRYDLGILDLHDPYLVDLSIRLIGRADIHALIAFLRDYFF